MAARRSHSPVLVTISLIALLLTILMYQNCSTWFEPITADKKLVNPIGCDECTLNEFRCQGNMVQECQAIGSCALWQDLEQCDTSCNPSTNSCETGPTIDCNYSAPSGWEELESYTGDWQESEAQSLYVRDDGTVFVAGYIRYVGGDPYRIENLVIRKRSPAGAWQGLFNETWGAAGVGTKNFAEKDDGRMFLGGYAQDSTYYGHDLLFRSNTQGGSWTVVDDTVNEKGARLLAFDSQQNLISVRNFDWWVTEKSSDDGATWAVMDTFFNAKAYDLVIGPGDNIMSIGAGRFTSDAWIVRRKAGQDLPWYDADFWEPPQNDDQEGWAITVGPENSVFGAGIEVTAESYPVTSKTQWVVRRSLDGGSNWDTEPVDRLVAPGDYKRSYAYDIHADQNGNIVAVGSDNFDETYSSWRVRLSQDLGETWQDLPLPNVAGIARSVFVSDNGDIYVAGSVTSLVTYKDNWAVYRLQCQPQ